MFQDGSGQAGPGGCAFATSAGHDTGRELGEGRSRKTFPGCVKVKRGLRLNMANTPKKVKDPTEVALSAIQEALNISDAPTADDPRDSLRNDVTPPNSSA